MQLAETASDPARSWEARPWPARIIRGGVVLGPLMVASLVAIVCNQRFAIPETTNGIVARSLLMIAVAMAVLWFVDRIARRLLPLATLLRLSLVFPDRAPSRFRAALKSGSSRRLERLVDNARSDGFPDDPRKAAGQVVTMISAIGDHDRRTRGHSERVRLYADLIGEEMGLSDEERQKLQWGALLHDLGKLTVPPDILNKKGRPDHAEWDVIERHPRAGMGLIDPMREFLGEWVHAIGGHHEKWDGTGYPDRLRGDEIPLSAAIVAVADSYEVMTAVRSYKKAMSPAAARAELTKCAGTHFSPEVVRAFLSISLGRIRLVAGPFAALVQFFSFGTTPAGASANPAPPTAAAAAAAGAAGAGGAGGAAGALAGMVVPVAAAVVTIGVALAFILPMAAKVGKGPTLTPASSDSSASDSSLSDGSAVASVTPAPAPASPTPNRAAGSTGRSSSSGAGTAYRTTQHPTGGSTAPVVAPPSAAPQSVAPVAASPPPAPALAAPSATPDDGSGSGSSSGTGTGATPTTSPSSGGAGNDHHHWHHHGYGND